MVEWVKFTVKWNQKWKTKHEKLKQKELKHTTQKTLLWINYRTIIERKIIIKKNTKPKVNKMTFFICILSIFLFLFLLQIPSYLLKKKQKSFYLFHQLNSSLILLFPTEQWSSFRKWKQKFNKLHWNY